MNEQYPIGTICIYQNIPGPKAYLNGSECEIIGALETRYVASPTGETAWAACYLVRDSDANDAACPEHLRRKPPKQSDKEWAEGKVREITQDSVHVGGGSKHLIPEETA